MEETSHSPKTSPSPGPILKIHQHLPRQCRQPYVPSCYLIKYGSRGFSSVIACALHTESHKFTHWCLKGSQVADGEKTLLCQILLGTADSLSRQDELENQKPTPMLCICMFTLAKITSSLTLRSAYMDLFLSHPRPRPA